MELKVSLFVPAHNPASVLLARLAYVVRERSGGRLRLRIFHSEQLGATAAQYDLACRGVADIAYMIHSATPGRFPLTELAHLPPVPDAIAGTAALRELLPEYLAPEHAGVKVLFLAANTPMAIHSAAASRSVADLNGKRIGHTGRVVATTLTALGAVPVTVMPLQIHDALVRGAIDAASMTYEAALVTRLAGAACCSFELNANTITFGLVMNRERYESLPPDLRRIVDEVLGAEAGAALAAMLANAAEEGKRYMRNSGVEIIHPHARDEETLCSLTSEVSAGFIAQLSRQQLPARYVFETLKRGLL